ncbi:flagellar biosynthesis anti-sigma factor FlgM [Desulfolithobacter sp.]
MTVNFFGVQGFGQVGGVRKTDSPGGPQKAEKGEKGQSTTFATALQGASEMQATTPTQNTERAARVQALKEQVSNGSYQPDLDRVASSLLKFLVEEG